MPGFLPHFLGDRGERAAVRFLKQQGCRILQKQYRNSYGEIDIIAEHKGVTIFAEVKTRSSDADGAPWEAVQQKQRDRISRAALCWLKKHNRLERPARLDVISILWRNDQSAPEIQHFPSAFESGDRGQLY